MRKFPPKVPDQIAQDIQSTVCHSNGGRSMQDKQKHQSKFRAAQRTNNKPQQNLHEIPQSQHLMVFHNVFIVPHIIFLHRAIAWWKFLMQGNSEAWNMQCKQKTRIVDIAMPIIISLPVKNVTSIPELLSFSHRVLPPRLYPTWTMRLCHNSHPKSYTQWFKSNFCKSHNPRF